MAVRHLCAAPYNDSKFAAYLPLWDAALSRWAAASAWYGLHGHHFLGRLAAVNTLLAVRQRLAETTTAGGTPQSIQGTRGALASEYYSIAKSTGSRKQRRVLLKRALANVDLALLEATSDQSGLIGIRGSILQALGRLREGLSDYRRMFDLRVDNGENEGRIGEAEAELGMGYLRLGHVWLAGRLLGRGVANLERSGRAEFLVRALRKLATFYLVTLRPWRALSTLKRAYTIADGAEMEGQLRQIRPTLRVLQAFDWRRWSSAIRTFVHRLLR
jgi:tetratricopeptide (TPR) repeat protein